MIDQKRTYDQILAENLALKEELTQFKSKQGIIRALNAQRLYGQLILREDDENQLLKDICKITVEVVGYKMAWVGLALDDKTVLPVASAGFDKDYLNNIKVTWGNDQYSEGPVGQAIKKSRYIVMQDILNSPQFEAWRESAIKNGFRSAIAIPLFLNKTVIGSINIYSDEKNAFGKTELKILLQAASDLSLGISNFRDKKIIDIQSAELNRAKEHTELKLAEAKVIKAQSEENEQKYKQIFDNTLDHIFILDITDDHRYKVIAVNPIQKKEVGILQPGKFIDECLPSELFTAFRQNYDRCVEEQKMITYEETITSKNLEQTFFTQLIPIKNNKGHIYRLIGIARNISETTNLTNQLITQNERLSLLNADLITSKEKAEESDRLKSAFLANMSHEIRTPMNGILGFAELLKMPGLTGEQQDEYIQIIKTSGDRMLNIINDIVDISKIESGQMKILLSETRINEQTEFIHTFFKPEAARKGISLVCKNGLTDNQSVVRTDREKVYAILTNLIKNAIKYSDSGTIELGYRLKSSGSSKDNKTLSTDPTDILEFYVKDSGIGIPSDRIHAIFDRFVQADIADTRAFQGAGLGLSISKAYVHMLGGEIWVESEEGQGSVFYFTLPYYPLKERAWPSDTVQASMDMKAEKKLKILIVEDDEISQMLISIAFIKFSKEILKVENGNDAVDICRKNPDIDLVFMDIKLPGIDGYEATRQIRAFNSSVYIIAQTAFGLKNERETALQVGCNEYVSKPLNINFLKELIHAHFEK
ncbi:MAG: ATP-binding protein [Bacteroidales bacterium]|nr:ATP-binding protein [Bacteroidales bacterium]